MHALAETLADEAQPRQAGMGGFRHCALHIEMEYGLGRQVAADRK
jgi:hypothetical protein